MIWRDTRYALFSCVASLNIALLVKFKMALFDKGKQSWINIESKYCVGWW